MSNVSNRHAIVPFIAGTSQPLADQRLARVICKQTAKMTKEGITALPSVCASVPMIASDAIEAAIPRMLDHIRAMLEDAQDGIIRAMHESTQGNATVVTDDDISVDQCIAFMDARAAGSRISAESVGAWFNATAKEYVVAFIADKLRFSEMTPDNLRDRLGPWRLGAALGHRLHEAGGELEVALDDLDVDVLPGGRKALVYDYKGRVAPPAARWMAIVEMICAA